MKIKRVVNGQEMEFELTGNEMYQAYEECKFDYMLEDVMSKYEEDEYDVDLSQEQFKEVAKLASRNLSKNDGYYESYWLSIEYTIEQYIDDIKNKEGI